MLLLQAASVIGESIERADAAYPPFPSPLIITLTALLKLPIPSLKPHTLQNVPVST